MALLNIFKKNKPEVAKKVEKKIIEKKEAAIQPASVTTAKKTAAEPIYRVLKFPHVTEKATNLTDKNQYIFDVFPGSGKIEIKKAIESLYGVKVVKVAIINVPGKRRRLGRTQGWRGGYEKGYKKAIVKLQQGQKIEVLPK